MEQNKLSSEKKKEKGKLTESKKPKSAGNKTIRIQNDILYYRIQTMKAQGKEK